MEKRDGFLACFSEKNSWRLFHFCTEFL